MEDWEERCVIARLRENEQARERERETDRQTETETERERDRGYVKVVESKREIWWERKSLSGRKWQIERQVERERENERERESLLNARGKLRWKSGR